MYAVHKHEKIDAVRKTKLNITDALLVKYLQGTLQENEMNGVAYAISASSDVRKQYEQLRMIWNECGRIGIKSTANVDDAWQRFQHGLGARQNSKNTFSLQAYNKWLRVAAVLLMLAGLAGGRYYLLSTRNDQLAVQQYTNASAIPKATPAAYVASTNNKANLPEKETRARKQANALAVKSDKGNGNEKIKDENKGNKAIVCNSTSSSMEICIIQKLKCPDGQSSIVSTCSKLQPDEANRLIYENFDKNAGSCKAIVDEITIKKVATGETMVFNADSKPVTAPELFSYISGQKKGDILAGEFESDCLAFNGRSGDFVLQQCPPGNNDNCD